MEQGWVYMLLNSSTPGLAKVGCTTRPPAERAAELSAATGVAAPFVVAFEQAFADCHAAERLVHAELDRRGLRLMPNREFFHGTPSDIVRVILDTADTRQPPPCQRPDLSAERLLAAGDTALYGRGDSLQDTGEAARCYKLAAARGSLIAFERLGRIYMQNYLEARDRAGRRRTLSVLKEGAKRGNYYCYCEMATLFAAERHLANFAKSWSLFFARRADSTRDELEADSARYPAACCVYIAELMDLRLQPSHLAELRAQVEAILSALLAELDLVRDNPAARQRLTSVMRWAYEELLDPPAPQPAAKSRRPIFASPWAPAAA